MTGWTYQEYNSNQAPEPSCPFWFDRNEDTDDLEVWLKRFGKGGNLAAASSQSAFVLMPHHHQSYFSNHRRMVGKLAEGGAIINRKCISYCFQ